MERVGAVGGLPRVGSELFWGQRPQLGPNCCCWGPPSSLPSAECRPSAGFCPHGAVGSWRSGLLDVPSAAHPSRFLSNIPASQRSALDARLGRGSRTINPTAYTSFPVVTLTSLAVTYLSSVPHPAFWPLFMRAETVSVLSISESPVP